MPSRIKDREKFDQFSDLLENFSISEFQLVGLNNPKRKLALTLQLVDSIRRIEYLRITSVRSRSVSLYTPYSGSFAPFGGASVLQKAGRTDDAFWLIYLATHFGKHKIDGWNLTEDFYGRFEEGGVWDWAAASQDPLAISHWLDLVYPDVTSAGRSRRFGNHRKFETLKPGLRGTGHALATYIRWIGRYGSHHAMINHAQRCVGQNPQDVYAYLYKDLEQVAKLGRLGKFDLLCNLSNLMIAPILPDKAYIAGSTGPKAGAELLFGGELSSKDLENASAKLAEHLGISPQAIEDALCNWQKSPDKHVYFRG